MSRVFFLSYARPRSANPKAFDYVDRFERDLLDAVGGQIRAEDGVRVGFRDSCSIEAGTDGWSNDLATQLAAYPIGIVLLSPAYLENNRPWCKWECTYLGARNAAVARLPDGIVPAKPRLLLIVDWIKPDEKDIPDGFPSNLQRLGESIAGGDGDDIRAVRTVLNRGLRATLELVATDDVEWRRDYQRFLQVLGLYVIEQWRRWQAMDAHQFDLPLPPPFNGEDCWALVRPNNAAAPAKPRPDRALRRKVYVVYFAGRPHEVGDERAWRYKDDGEYDWQPFASQDQPVDETHIGDFMNELAEVEVKEWPFDYFRANMKGALALAGERYPLLIIVDPWTATQLDRYRKALEQYVRAERDVLVYSSPVVIWNEQDGESQAVRTEFELQVGNLFSRTRWEPVTRRDELKDCLREIVNGLQRKIRNALADGLPATGSTPPRISPSR